MSELKERLKEYEGTKAYQGKLNYFRNGKFWTYRDTNNFSTIGYGHLLKKSETFPNGITELEADKLLDDDIAIATRNLSNLNLSLSPDWNDFMIIMIFQLGLGGVQKFKKMLAALRDKNYHEAIRQAKDSLWYRQTPNRVDQMINVLTNK